MSTVQNDTRFHLTVTANYSDDTEVNDIDVSTPVSESAIGGTAIDAAMLNAPAGASITSLVIVAVVVNAA